MPIVIGGDPKEARKGKKTVAIVGFAPTTRDLVPYDDPNVEVWGLNEAYFYNFMKDKDGNNRWDRWFQIHQRWSFTRLNNENHNEHWRWLQGLETECRCHFVPRMVALAEAKGMNMRVDYGPNKPQTEEECTQCNNGVCPPRDFDIPIYMMPEPFVGPDEWPDLEEECFDDVPGSVVFPYWQIVEKYLGKVHRQVDEEIIINEYFTSSFAYMCGLALYLGFERIEVYGFEMATETEYMYQKGSTEFWIGIASQHVEVYLPHRTTRLLYGELYGVEVTQMINRQHLGFRHNQLVKMHNQAVTDLNIMAGRKAEAMEVFEQTRQRFAESQKALGEARSPGEKKRAQQSLEKLGAELDEKRKRAEDLFNLELKQVNQVNAIIGAKAEIEAQLNHIDCMMAAPEEDAPDTDVRGVPVGIIPAASLEVSGVPRTETQEVKEEDETAPDGGC